MFLATRKQLRPNRNGQLYLQVELADKSGSITGRMWNASDDEFNAFDDGDFVRVEGTVQLYSGSLQIIVTGIGRVDPRTVDESEFHVLSPADRARLRGEESPGRALDFLTQELAREANTIASKCPDATIAHAVVDAKTRIERLREMVQNVE